VLRGWSLPLLLQIHHEFVDINMSATSWRTKVICKVLNHLYGGDGKDITLHWWGEIADHKRVTKERT
jgi:hypothetical protein